MQPSDALAKVRLGEMYRDLGRTDDAIRLLREAVTIEPQTASYWNSLGMVLGGAVGKAHACAPTDRPSAISASSLA